MKRLWEWLPDNVMESRLGGTFKVLLQSRGLAPLEIQVNVEDRKFSVP